MGIDLESKKEKHRENLHISLFENVNFCLFLTDFGSKN